MQEELRPFAGQARNNVTISGVPIFLQPRGALAMGMAVHELVTNAVKYGALPVPEGKVAIHWDVVRANDVEQLVWHWNEQAGPQMVPPGHHGFGLSMIERSLHHELKGEAKFEFAPAGLRGTLTIPLDPAIAGHADSKEVR